MRLRLMLLAASASFFAAEHASAKDTVYMSLMGEPFRTNVAGENPFDQWFKLADQDGDGAISSVEFRSDATSFFTSLDRNGDKVIDADEMAEYEQLAPGRTRAAGGGAVMPPSNRPHPVSAVPVEKGQVPVVTDGSAPSATRIHPADGRINFSDVPQPVAMADYNLDRRVTLAEFIRKAVERFSIADANNDGRLARKELR